MKYVHNIKSSEIWENKLNLMIVLVPKILLFYFNLVSHLSLKQYFESVA